ncbi:MAG TPA: hypothetical protein VNH82_08235 [Candidatus Dormibacteraeota bacterium]|nr:hypothetical protein [Candidatus Dormibacteraeota bacterium]
MAIFGAIGVAALALIGAGAAATFNTQTTSTQTINAGTLSVVLSSPDAPGCTLVSDGCTSLTLNSVGADGSTFDTTPSLVTITNNGTVPAYYDTMSVSDTNNNSTFQSEVGMCDYSYGGDGTGHFVGTDYNGLLSGIEASSPNNVSGTGDEYVVQPGQTDSYTVDFYAGAITDACGTSTLPALTQPAEGGSLTVSLTYAYTG